MSRQFSRTCRLAAALVMSLSHLGCERHGSTRAAPPDAPAAQPHSAATVERPWRYGDPLPIAQLPARVDAPPGKLTLFADFENREEGGIPLYLVNLTDKTLAFRAQDGDPFVKLEAMNAAGTFERAQMHYYSMCGNSYFHRPMLRPGEFTRYRGYQPEQGAPRTVRYRIYSDVALIMKEQPVGSRLHPFERPLDELPIELVSNAGPGLAADAEIAEARVDAMAVQFGPFEIIRDVALGRTKPTVVTTWWRGDAIASLSRHPTDECADLLAKLIDDAEVRQMAVFSLAKIGVKNRKAELRYQSLLSAEDTELRALAIAAMAERPVTAETIAFGCEQMQSEDRTIRMAAISMLAQLAHTDRHPDAKQALIDHTNDPDPEVRQLLESLRSSWRER